MSRIRGKNTVPEKVVRSILHRLGFRFDCMARTCPGGPTSCCRNTKPSFSFTDVFGIGIEDV
jgi:G:T-mismatch repair DNA endonuclease (very short patch repair protein)